MKKLLLVLVAFTVLLGFQVLAKPAYAHGGSYRGPAGEVPPGQRDPKDPQPPPENPTTPTGPPQGPGTGEGGGTPTGGGENPSPPPDSNPGTPQNPQGPVAGPPQGGVATPGGRVAQQRPISFENWLFWWAYNKNEILNLKAAIKKMENKQTTTGSGPFLGRGFDQNRSENKAPTEAMIQQEIVPALDKVVENPKIHPDIRGGALIALARCGANPKNVQTFFKVADPNADEDKVVRESAILALGIMQLKSDEIRDYLIKFIDNRDDQFRARCFALLALGLLQDDSKETYDCLMRCLDGSEATTDVPVSAIMALGLIGDNSRLPEMLKWLDDGRVGRGIKLSDLEKSHLVGAIGRIGDPEAMKPVHDLLRKKGQYTRRSAYIAFGQILPQADEKTQSTYVTKLAHYIDAEDDITAKNFGYIALGRVAGQVDCPESVRNTAVTVLKKAFKDGGKATERPFAALALGLVGFEPGATKVKPQELKYELAELIRNELSKLKGDKVALGAQATALGMLGDNSEKTLKLLIGILKDPGEEKKLRGAAAMALGLIGDNSAKEAIINALREREDRDLRVDTAVAAGLLGDSSAVDTLVDVLQDPKASQFVLGSVALALGQIGDHRAIPALISILEPEKTNSDTPDLTRALVAVALGQIADRRDIRVLDRISKDINYRASVSALDEVLTIL